MKTNMNSSSWDSLRGWTPGYQASLERQTPGVYVSNSCLLRHKFLLKLGQNSKRRRSCFTFTCSVVLLPALLGSETWVDLHSKVSSVPSQGCSSPGGVFSTTPTLVQARTPGCESYFLRRFGNALGSRSFKVSSDPSHREEDFSVAISWSSQAICFFFFF